MMSSIDFIAFFISTLHLGPSLSNASCTTWRYSKKPTLGHMIENHYYIQILLIIMIVINYVTYDIDGALP